MMPLRDEGGSRATGVEARFMRLATVLYILLLAAVIVAVDILFFKQRFWERLAANVGIVLLFVAFYVRFVKHP